MTAHKIKPIELGYSQKYRFYPRMINIRDERNFDARFIDIPDGDPEKEQREFALYKEFLGSFCDQPPEYLKNGKGEPKWEKLPGDTPMSAIETAFKEMTPENERVVTLAYRIHKSRLDPEINF
jgi:hypothetical protein